MREGKPKEREEKKMTREELKALVEQCGDDIDMYEFDDEEEIELTVNDFGGFDEDWCEIDREYDVEKVHELFETLKKECIEFDEDFYTTFQFDGFYVTWGYGSYDI